MGGAGGEGGRETGLSPAGGAPAAGRPGPGGWRHSPSHPSLSALSPHLRALTRTCKEFIVGCGMCAWRKEAAWPMWGGEREVFQSAQMWLAPVASWTFRGAGVSHALPLVGALLTGLGAPHLHPTCGHGLVEAIGEGGRRVRRWQAWSWAGQAGLVMCARAQRGMQARRREEGRAREPATHLGKEVFHRRLVLVCVCVVCVCVCSWKQT